MKDFCNSIDECNPGKKREVFLVFDDMISNKKYNPVVTKLFITGWELIISLVFIA